jgi:pyrroloquinoline quinone (PQQ) biosynthesis protein C
MSEMVDTTTVAAPRPGSGATDLHPLLRFDAVPVLDDAAVLDLDDRVVTLAGVTREQARLLFPLLDGRSAVGDLAVRTGIPEPQLRVLLARLAEAGVVVSLPPAAEVRLIDGRAFAAACRFLFPVWKERLFSHSLWRSLADGTATREQFAGWLLESYHFIEGVTLRLPSVIAATAEPRIRRHFVRHFREEFDHHHFFMHALNALGISSRTVHASRPLPGTEAVLNWMRRCGRDDPLAYAACSGFLESTGADRGTARRFFDVLAENYDLPSAPVVTPLAAHAHLDEDYGHGGFLELVCAEIGAVPESRADAALQAAAGLVETLELWSSDLERHYRHAPVSDAPIRRYRMDRSS